MPFGMATCSLDGFLGHGLPEEAFNDLLLPRALVADADDQAGGDISLCASDGILSFP
jgi:hypothetical protein